MLINIINLIYINYNNVHIEFHFVGHYLKTNTYEDLL